MKMKISETTREEREKLVYKALGISLTGASMPSSKAMILAQKYIDGYMELEEVQKLIVEEYKKNV